MRSSRRSVHGLRRPFSVAIPVGILAIASACAEPPTAPQFGVPAGATANSAGDMTTASAYADAASDRVVLNALYQATGGSSWVRNTNWGSDQPLNRWYGVSTDSKGRVVRLTLWSNGLTGAIPAQLGQLTELEFLSLPGNSLTGAIPPELGGLAELEALYLHFNGLSGAIPAELGNLTELEILYLYRNNLSGAIPPELGDLAELEALYLYDNSLSGTIPAEFGSLTELESLQLHNNRLSGAIPAELGNLARLRSLYLYNNSLSGAIPTELGDLAELEWLHLANNGLTGAIPTELGDLAELEWLFLYGNSLTDAIPTELGQLAELRGLWLESNSLTGPIPQSLFTALPNLQYFLADDNALSGSLPATLGTHVFALTLANNELTGSIPFYRIGTLDVRRSYLTGCIPAAYNSRSIYQLSRRFNPQREPGGGTRRIEPCAAHAATSGQVQGPAGPVEYRTVVGWDDGEALRDHLRRLARVAGEYRDDAVQGTEGPAGF